MVHRILLVDDDENITDSIRRHLYRQREFADVEPAATAKPDQPRLEVHVSHTGEAALKRMAAEGEFSVILTDLKMPGMDGIAFLVESHVTGTAAFS